MVETAVVCSAAFLLLLGLIVGALGVFRYQEVAHLAREGARYASTHGGKYIEDGIPSLTGVPAITSDTDLRNYLLPRCVLMDPNQLDVKVSWTGTGKFTPASYPTYADATPGQNPPAQKVVRNYVTVTVTYNWLPELFLVGPIKLTSTASVPMSY
jgi:hypothetical protein